MDFRVINLAPHVIKCFGVGRQCVLSRLAGKLYATMQRTEQK
jgi:hypothetical protein